jgi:uncharacterized protein
MVALKRIYRGKYFLYLILSLSMLQILSGSKLIDKGRVAYASSSEAASITSDTDDRRVYDEAGLLNSYEIEELEAKSQEHGEKAGIEIFILTHNDSNSTYPEKYIEDFEDQLPIGDRVYFLYDVYRGEIFMEGYGLTETYIHSKRIDKIFDSVEDYLRNEYYYDAFDTYITMSAAYMADDSELNYDHDYSYDKTPEGFDSNNEYKYDEYNYDKYYKEEDLENNMLLNFWFQLIVALAIGALVVGALAYRSSGRMTAGARDYLDRRRQGLIGRRDQYIRSTVTRWRKPSQNNTSGGSRGGFNSGGFRGGVSSGGRSHSSGGRKL